MRLARRDLLLAATAAALLPAAFRAAAADDRVAEDEALDAFGGVFRAPALRDRIRHQASKAITAPNEKSTIGMYDRAIRL